jgi:formyltetrahydrofolate deformylase
MAKVSKIATRKVEVRPGQRRLVSITVIGRDRTGVIARFTNMLFVGGANIEALEEQVQHGMFSMTLQASWPAATYDFLRIRQDAEGLAKELSMDLTLRELLTHQRPRLAVLVTKEPHCLQALLKAKLACDLVLVVGNYPDLGELALRAKIPFYQNPWLKRIEAEARLSKLLAEHEIDFIVLARFMRILSPGFVWRWKNRIINIHPSLLPAFPGANAYRQAYEKGVKIAGVTAHFVTPHLDEGPILSQEAFRIDPAWNLAKVVERGQQAEARTLLAGMKLFLQQRYDVYWGKVHERRP